MRILTVALGAALIAAPAFAQTTQVAPATPAAPAVTAPGTTAAPPAATPPAATTAKPVKPRLPFVQRFDNANTTRDGKLTLDQAKSAKMTGVIKHFAAIDKDKHGYITKADVEAFRKANKQKQGEL